MVLSGQLVWQRDTSIRKLQGVKLVTDSCSTTWKRRAFDCGLLWDVRKLTQGNTDNMQFYAAMLTEPLPDNDIQNIWYIILKNDSTFSYLIIYWYYPSRHGPDFHRPQSQIPIDSPDFHLRRSQNWRLGCFFTHITVLFLADFVSMEFHHVCLHDIIFKFSYIVI